MSISRSDTRSPRPDIEGSEIVDRDVANPRFQREQERERGPGGEFRIPLGRRGESQRNLEGRIAALQGRDPSAPPRIVESQLRDRALQRIISEPGEQHEDLRRRFASDATRLGQQLVEPINPRMLADPHVNFLQQRWDDLHEQSGQLPPPPGQTRVIQARIQELVSTLGLATYLHPELNTDTLSELAHQTVENLKSQRAEFTEAEYMYVVSEAVTAWAEKYHRVDPSRIEHISDLLDDNTARGVFRDAFYAYRSEMAAAYSEAANEAAAVLTTGSYTAEERKHIIDSHFPAGDRELFHRTVLNAEMAILDERTENFIQEAQEAFQSKFSRELKALGSGDHSIDEFNTRIEALQEQFLADPVLQSRLEDLERRRATNAADSKMLFTRYAPPDHYFRTSHSRLRLQNDDIMATVVSESATQAFTEKLNAMLSFDNRELDLEKRYGELHDLLVDPRGYEISEEQQRAHQELKENIESRLYKFVARREMDSTIESLRSEDHGRLHREIRSAILSAKGRVDPDGFSAQQSLALYRSLDRVSLDLGHRVLANPDNPAAHILTPEEVSTILDHYGSGERLLNALDENPRLEQDIGRFLKLASGYGHQVNLGENLSVELRRRVQEARETVFSSLVDETRSYANERNNLVDSLATARVSEPESEQTKAAELRLASLEESYQQRREKLLRLVDGSTRVENYLDQIITSPTGQPTPDRQTQDVLNGDYALAAAVHIHDAFQAVDPVTALDRVVKETRASLSPAELEQAISDRYGTEELTQLLRSLPEEDQLLATSILGGIDLHPTTILSRLHVANQQFVEGRTERIEQFGVASSELEEYDTEFARRIQENREQYLSDPDLLQHTKKAVAESELLTEQIRELELEQSLRRELSPEAYAALDRVLTNYQTVSENAAVSTFTEESSDQQYLEGVLNSSAAEDIIASLGSDEASLRQTLFQAPQLAAQLAEFISLRTGNESGQALGASINDSLQQTLSSAEDVRGELRQLAVELHLQPHEIEGSDPNAFAIRIDTDERSYLYRQYEAARLAEERESSAERRVEKTELTEESLGEDSQEIAALLEEATPLVQEIIRHAERFGPLIELEGAEPSSDPWIRRLREVAKSDYTQKMQELYQHLEGLNANSPASIDLNRIRTIERSALAESGARRWLTRNPNSSWEQREEAGVTEALSAEDINTIVTQERARPLTDFILKTEVSWAHRFAEAEGDPAKLAELEREKEATDGEKLADAYRSLRSVTYHSEILDYEKFTERVQEIVANERQRRTATLVVDSLLEEGRSREEIVAAIAADERLSSILTEEALVEYAGRRQSQLLLSGMDESMTEIAQALGSSTDLSVQFDAEMEEIPGIGGEESTRLLAKYREFQDSLQSIAAEYPETVNAERIERMASLNIRRAQVSSWIGANAEREWSELETELNQNGAFDFVPPAKAKEQVFLAQAKPIVDEMLTVQYLIGATVNAQNHSMLDDNQHLAATEKMRELKARRTELEREFKYLVDKFPEFPQRFKFQEAFYQANQSGLRKFGEAIEQAKDKSQREAQAREDAKDGFERAWDIVENAAMQLPKIAESADYLLWGNAYQVAFGTEAAGEYINRRRAEYQDVFGVSVFGSDEEFARMGDWEAAMSVNPLGHVGNALVEPVFSMLELGYDEYSRAVIGGDLSYREFKELQATDPLLKWGTRSLQTAQIAGSLALMLSSGGGTTISSAARMKRALNIMGVSSGMSVLGATSEEWLNPEDFNLERFLDNTLKGTSNSMLFMAGTTMMSNAYVRLRFGKVPVGAELEALRVSDPLRFEKLSRTLKQGQMIGEVIDAADGLSDMSGAFALVDDIDYNNPEHLAALAARFGMSLWDTVDWKSSTAGNVSGPTDSAPQVIENFNLNDVVGDVRFSGNGQALFVSNQDLVAELYVQSRVKDLETSSDHQGMTQEQLLEIARTESQGVVAFAERDTGRMVVPETRGADRQQRIIAASFMAHENAHLEGKPEFDAWRAQADYLERNGLQLEFSNGQPIIRAASGDVVVHTPDSHIEEYLAANYSARDRGEQGTLPQVMAARNTSTSGELSTVTSQEAADLLEFWDEDQAALNPDERSDLYWALRGQEMLGLAENVELLETAARERLVAELGLTDAMSIEERDLTARRAEAMGLLETAPEAVQQQLVDAVSIVSLAESYNADPSSLTASDATELFFAARRQNETARIDDLAALESTVRAHLQSEADQLRVNTRSLSIREQAVLQQQLTDLDMLEMQDGGVKQTLARAVEIDALRREYRADPASMTRERRGELYWALHERGEIAGDPAADALKQSAQEIAQDTAYQIEADLSAASHRQLLELEHQLSVLGMLGQQSAELRGQLDSAVDFELQLTTVAEGDIVGESEFVDFAASLRALMRQEQRPLEAYLPSTHPQYHRLAENLSRIDGQDLGELVERVAAQTGESVETVEQVLHDMSLYAGQHGSITREGVEHIRAQLRERGMLKRGAEDTNAVIFIPGGDTVADQLAAMPLGRNHARLNTTSDITEADVLIVDQAILHRLENDADFARAVVENDVQLMVVGGYAGTLNLDGTRGRDALGQIEQQLTASVEQFRASRARATTVPQLTTDELSTQLEGVFDALEKENYYLGDSLGGFSDDTLGRRLLLSGLNNNGLLIQAEKLVENGDADNLVTALEQVTQSELDTLLDLAREARAEGKEIDPQVYSELRHYTEIMAGIQRYRENLTSRLGYSGSGLQVPGTDTAELVRRAIRSHDLGIPHRRVDVMSPAVPESGNVREAIVDQLGQPPVRFETHSELEQDGLYLSDRYGWIQVVGRTADGALEVIRFEKKPRTPLTADQIAGRNPVDGSQRRPPRRIITIQPDSNLRFADWRNDVALSNQALVDRGITVENAALWFSMGDLHQQFANRPREGVAARRYERLNSILQEVAPGQNLDTFLQQMEQSLVGGELSAENAATAQQFLIEVYRQTGVDLVQIGTARQAAQNAAYSWRSFPEIVAEPTVFNGQTDVARVDIFVDSFVRDQLWENGVSVFDPNLREGSTQGQEHPRRAFFNDFYPKGREGENRPVNEFSRRMWELKKDAEEGRMDDLATHATEMVQENREALNAFLAEHAELLDGRPVVVVSMPGSSGAQSASAALAEAVAEELGYDHQQLLDRRSERHTRGRNSDRQSRVETKPQKTQKTRTRRMRNSGNTYALNADGESLAENTVVILIDDNSTYDVTLNVGRERLLPNDVLAISFGRTVRSQSNVSN